MLQETPELWHGRFLAKTTAPGARFHPVRCQTMRPMGRGGRVAVQCTPDRRMHRSQRRGELVSSWRPFRMRDKAVVWGSRFINFPASLSTLVAADEFFAVNRFSRESAREKEAGSSIHRKFRRHEPIKPTQPTETQTRQTSSRIASEQSTTEVVNRPNQLRGRPGHYS